VCAVTAASGCNRACSLLRSVSDPIADGCGSFGVRD
jgi:hypothetical protein